MSNKKAAKTVEERLISTEEWDALVDADASKAERINELCDELAQVRTALFGTPSTLDNALDKRIEHAIPLATQRMYDLLNSQLSLHIDAQIIRALVRSRDILSVELSFKEGLMSAEEYEEALHKLLVEPQHDANLRDKVKRLLYVIPFADGELVSTVFDCPIGDAIKAIQENK